jgi:H+/Cl- antiporter ClcA
VLSAAGSFSSLSALFDGPIVAGLLLVEASLSLGASALPILLPGLVAAAIGYLVFIGFGNFGGLNAPGLLVPNLPAYQGTHLVDLAIAILVGLAMALLVTLIHRVAAAIEALQARPRGMPLLLLAGGLAVGLIALIAERLGANPNDVLFSGQASIGVVATATSGALVLLLIVAKTLGYIVSLGCGFRGGPIFPAVFLGIALASLPVAWFGVSPTLAVAVGAAAGMASQTRLLFAPLLFAALLVGHEGFDAVSAVVLASVAAWLAINALAHSPLSGTPPAAPAAPTEQASSVEG